MSATPPQGHVHYIHRLSYTARERLVGAFVIFAIALVFIALAFNQQTARFFASKFTLHADLHNAMGISTDTPVTASGLFVGTVSAITITPDNRIALTMKILEKYHKLIREDSRAEVSKLSLLGNSAIDISAGSPNQPLIPDGATIPLQEPLSLDQIMAQVAPVLQDVKTTLMRIDAMSQQIDPRAVGQVVNNLAVVSGNLKAISTQLASGQGTAGKLIYDKTTGENTAAAMQALAATLKQTQASLKSVQPLLSNANAASADLPALIAQSRKLVTQLNTTMGSVNYQLQALPDMVVRTRQILDNTDQTLQAIQNTWPISSSVPKPSSTVITPVHPPND
ncbi:MAG TPA: MlaD family protein [Gammaproteobacteria bacterium]|nr:MlaD family protein [Gammaproteobacteria bacterium]